MVGYAAPIHKQTTQRPVGGLDRRNSIDFKDRGMSGWGGLNKAADGVPTGFVQVQNPVESTARGLPAPGS